MQDKISKKNEYYKQLYIDKLEGLISQEEFAMLREKFANEVDEYKHRIKIIESEMCNIKTREEKVNSSKAIFEKYRKIEILTKSNYLNLRLVVTTNLFL